MRFGYINATPREALEAGDVDAAVRPALRATGNAVVVPVGEVIGHVLLDLIGC